MAEVASIDPERSTVTLDRGERLDDDSLSSRRRRRPTFFGTPGRRRTRSRLYSLDDAERLRSPFFAVFEDADRDPSLVDRGALNFVVVGGGPTGVETAGALADMIERDDDASSTATSRSRRRAVHPRRPGDTLLGPFSSARTTTSRRSLRRKGSSCTSEHARSTEVDARRRDARATATERSRRACVDLGRRASRRPVAARSRGDGRRRRDRGGRIDVQPDLTVAGLPARLRVGDVANITGPDGKPLPAARRPLRSRAASWAAKNLLADFAGRPPQPFQYKDKGIMAMIGRGTAIAAMGRGAASCHGPIAFAAWLGVHAAAT